MRYCFTFVKMAFIKKQEITSAGEDVERKEKDGSFLMAMKNSMEILQNLKIELPYDSASPIAQLVKNLPAMLETCIQFLGQEDPLEKEMATHSSILAWRIL